MTDTQRKRHTRVTDLDTDGHIQNLYGEVSDVKSRLTGLESWMTGITQTLQDIKNSMNASQGLGTRNVLVLLGLAITIAVPTGSLINNKFNSQKELFLAHIERAHARINGLNDVDLERKYWLVRELEQLRSEAIGHKKELNTDMRKIRDWMMENNSDRWTREDELNAERMELFQDRVREGKAGE